MRNRLRPNGLRAVNEVKNCTIDGKMAFLENVRSAKKFSMQIKKHRNP